MARPHGEPTEAPTQQRLSRARQQGQVAISRDLSGALAFVALVGVFAATGPSGVARVLTLFRQSLGSAAGAVAGESGLAAAGWRAFHVTVPILCVPLGAALAVVIVAGAVQSGGLLAWQAIHLDLGRLSPAVGLRRLLSWRTTVDMGLGMLRVAVVLGVAVASSWANARELPHLAAARPLAVLTALAAFIEHLGICVALALVALGVMDWLIARWRHQRALMMTRDEVKREHKESEGDPRHRAERRRLHRELTEQRLIEDVRKADFVVVNPDHIAVAVKYDRDANAAPVVVARGERLLAERIKQVARESGVPIYRDVGLARALNGLPEGEEIPEALYEAVAELLRVLWELERPPTQGEGGEADASEAPGQGSTGPLVAARSRSDFESSSAPASSATWKRV